MSRFLPNLGTLRHQLMESVPEEQFRSAYFTLELLPYSMGATYQAVLDFVAAERDLITRTTANDAEGNVVHAIGPGGRDLLSYRIDAFLDAARRTQNAVVPYMSKALSISLPNSLADVIKRLDSNKLTLPDKIAADVRGYWSHQGKRLKDYRDLSQHHALVASEVRIFYASDGRPALYLALPNNPEDKSPTKLVFDAPTIQAYFYMKDQLHWLIRFCHEITSALAKPPPGNVRSVTSSIVFRSPLTLGPNAKLEGHYAIDDAVVESEINDLVSQLRRL